MYQKSTSSMAILCLIQNLSLSLTESIQNNTNGSNKSSKGIGAILSKIQRKFTCQSFPFI